MLSSSGFLPFWMVSMTVMLMKIGARSVCDKLEDSQSHLVQSSVHWHLRDSVTVPTNETLFPNGDNVVLGLNGAKNLLI